MFVMLFQELALTSHPFLLPFFSWATDACTNTIRLWMWDGKLFTHAFQENPLFPAYMMSSTWMMMVHSLLLAMHGCPLQNSNSREWLRNPRKHWYQARAPLQLLHREASFLPQWKIETSKLTPVGKTGFVLPWIAALAVEVVCSMLFKSFWLTTPLPGHQTKQTVLVLRLTQ